MVLVSSIESFGDTAVWSFLSQFFFLTAALLLGNTIRRKVPIIRKSLMPTALIGGSVILLLKLIPQVDSFINYAAMETVTYHCLAIGFIAVSLKKRKGAQKASVKTIIETGIVQGSTYVIQAIVGLAVTITLSLTLAGGFFSGGGVLLALGFGQGTGQALNYGKIFESDYGFAGGTTFGLSIATIGFFVASVVGVVYMNILRRRGRLTIAQYTEKPAEQLEDYVSENEIPNTESVDKLTINVALILFVYAVAYLIMRAVNIGLVWGFNFLLGALVALLVKVTMHFMQKKKIMHRELINDYLLDRVSGFAFDFMIIAGMAAIDLSQLSAMWWQLLIICTLGTVVTFIYLRAACSHLYPGYENEAFLSLFGMLTGTASNGMILLREVDPSFKTPAAANLVLSGLPAIVFGGGLLVLLGYCPRGRTEAMISLVILLAAFVVFSLILFRQKVFRKKDTGAAVK